MIGLGCDHGGYELMQEVKSIWTRKGFPAGISDATAWVQ